jgi:hypothetical protein
MQQNSFTPLHESETGISEKWPGISALCSKISAVLLVVASLLYFVTVMRFSASNPFWMDEVLAIWTARRGSVAAIWSAILQGSDFAPPGYHVLLLTVMRLGGTSHLALRLPSILAVFVTAVCVYLLLRKRFSLPVAAFAMTLVLTSVLYNFAVQARPYALVAACFALVVLIWDSSNQDLSFGKCLLIFLLLAFAISLHFYAVLVAAQIGILELLWFAVHRRIRVRLWSAIIAGGLSVLVWVPLATHITKYNAGDTNAPKFYGKPSLKRLLSIYSDLMIDKSDMALLLVFFCLAALALALFVYSPKLTNFSLPSEIKGRLGDLDLIILSAVFFPLTIFCFTLLVTKNFNMRYAVASVIGFALLFGRLLAQVRGAAIVSTVLLLFSCAALAGRASVSTGTERENINPLLHQAVKPLPIVIASGLDFLEFEEAATPDIKSRLYLVTMPPGIVNPDPTNENQAKRWGNIRSDLNIASPKAFFQAHPQFYIVSSSTTTDVLTPWLMQHNDLNHAIASNGNNWLFEASAP